LRRKVVSGRLRPCSANQGSTDGIGKIVMAMRTRTVINPIFAGRAGAPFKAGQLID
jgi:hypothetical protein